MNKDSLGRWLEVGANLGILFGLIFVGVQLIQDRELKAAEMIALSLQDDHLRQVAMMGEDPAAVLSKLDPVQPLDSRERFIVRSYFDARTSLWLRNAILEARGLLSANWRREFELPDELFANEYGIASLIQFRNSPYLPDGYRSQLVKEIGRLEAVVLNRSPKN